MHQKYEIIINKIKTARESGDTKALKRAKKQLEKWQLTYGAYAPIK